MYRNLRHVSLQHTSRIVVAVSALSISLVLASPLNAQTSSYQPATDDVSINWDALNGGGQVQSVMPSQSYGGAPVSQNGLLMPGAKMPHSTLHVAPPAGSKRVKLSKPAATPKAAPKPVVAKAPAKPAAPKPVAQSPAPKPPAAAPNPPKKLAEKKPEAPAPTQTASAPPPPPPPAPAAAAAPPPPPIPATDVATNMPAAPEAPAAPTEQASTSTATPSDDGTIQVIFNGGDTKLSADAQAAVDKAVGELEKSENARVQLMAFAAGENLTASQARRISLSRALSVRSYLIEKGIRSSRIDVRALGDKGEGDPKNRVDVNLIDR